MQTLNPLQLEILKLFRTQRSENELLELKQLLVNFLAQKVVSEADKAFEEKGYTPQTIEGWRTEHNRKKK